MEASELEMQLHKRLASKVDLSPTPFRGYDALSVHHFWCKEGSFLHEACQKKIFVIFYGLAGLRLFNSVIIY